MLKNLVDDHLILDAGDHFSFASALQTDRYIDVEYPLQTLRPGHGLMSLFWRLVFIFMMLGTFAAFGWRHIDTVFTVWREYSVESCQVHSRLGNQRGQLGDEIQRFKDDVRSSIAV